jgi:hypothetical protein
MRASYHVVRVTDDIVFIADDDIGMSVTNDAEAVVEDVFRKFPGRMSTGRRIVYRDTMGDWGELQHHCGTFTEFGPHAGPGQLEA